MSHLHDNESLTIVLIRVNLLHKIVRELHVFIKMDYDPAAISYFPYFGLDVRSSFIFSFLRRHYLLQVSKVAPIL